MPGDGALLKDCFEFFFFSIGVKTRRRLSQVSLILEMIALIMVMIVAAIPVKTAKFHVISSL